MAMHNPGIAELLRATMGMTRRQGGAMMSDVDAPPDERRQHGRVRKSARREKN
jgi:hypothetical protein